MLSIKFFPAEYGDCIMLSIWKRSQYYFICENMLSAGLTIQ